MVMMMMNKIPTFDSTRLATYIPFRRHCSGLLILVTALNAVDHSGDTASPTLAGHAAEKLGASRLTRISHSILVF
jgi:hypothetical protein